MSEEGSGQAERLPSVAQLCAELMHEVKLLTPKEWLWSLAYDPDKPMPPEVYLPLMKQYADYRLGPIIERIRQPESSHRAAWEQGRDAVLKILREYFEYQAEAVVIAHMPEYPVPSASPKEPK